MQKQDLIIIKVDRARQLLAEATTAPAAKRVVDIAHAAEVYAKRAKLGQQAIDYAHTVKIDAGTLLGQFLKAAEKNTGAKGLGTSVRTKETRTAPPTYADIGITHKEASEAQLLATIAEERPDLHKGLRDGTVKVTEARRQVRKAAVVENAKLPTEKYRVLYADPPWKYGDGREKLEGTTGASTHYPTMAIADLCAMPIEKLAQRGAVLFLWVTSPLLYEAASIVEAWGFVYKTSFVWDKVKHNLGHYNSVRHEFLLICTRGSCLPDSGKLIDSVQTIERSGKHSQKPEEFRAIIDQMYPHGKRIELFWRGKEKPKGWEVYGNEL